MNRCATTEIEQLKKQICDNVSVNDKIVCGLCDALIFAANQKQDWQSVAFGYVWRADYFFYTAGDLKNFAIELDLAQLYIDERTPSELLEKYYTLQHVLYENSYDLQSAFRCVLKALDVAEKLKLGHRIGANYGNIGAYYMEIGYYEEALQYTRKALETLRAETEINPRIIRLLLVNRVVANLKLRKYDMAKQSLEELAELPIKSEDLSIYIDYGYLLYYSEQLDLENSLIRLRAMFEDGLLEAPRAFAFEFLSKALEAMLLLKQQSKAEELLVLLKEKVKENEPDAKLSLCKLRIEYAQQFGLSELLQQSYREYYTCYMAVQKRTNETKAEGLHAKVDLGKLHSENIQSQNELRELSELANYDDLTKAYNRRYLNIRVEEILNSQHTPNIGFVIFDVDYFKEYNDYFGHPAGDTLLQKIANCLKENTTDQMAIFRYGGDEFVCLCWDTSFETLEAYVKQVQTSLIENKIDHAHSRCADRVTLSIGYGCQLVTGKIDMLALFEKVDEALYKAKNEGRNSAKSILDLTPTKEAT